MFFSNRSLTPEIMDDFSITDARIDRALKELETINKFLGGKAVTKKAVKIVSDGKPIKILDAGAGGFDNFENLDNVLPIAVDKNIRAAKYIKHKKSTAMVVCADALKLPFRKESFDVIHISLFLHHFDNFLITKLLNEFKSTAQKAIIINDLRRSLFAFAAIKVLLYLFSNSKIVKNDGPLSVKKSFTKSELLEIIKASGFKNYLIQKKWAFRWLVCLNL